VGTRTLSVRRFGPWEFTLPGQQHPTYWLALIVLFVLATAHLTLVWGYAGLYWGDAGRWLHEIDRFAHGELLYADFYWPFPPLAMWLLGTFARIFGTNTQVIWSGTAAAYLLTTLTFFWYVRLLLNRFLVLGTSVAGFILAVSYASGALPSGTYSPAAPIGFLFLLLATVLSLELLHAPSFPKTFGIGTLCGLCLLTKQDFWLPAVYLCAAGAAVLVASERQQKWVLPSVLVGTCAATVTAGMAVIIGQSGWRTALDMLGGFGNFAEFGSRGFPTLERLTLEYTAVAIVLLGVIVCLVFGGDLPFRQLRRLSIALVLIALFGCASYVVISIWIGLHPLPNSLPTQTEQLMSPPDLSAVRRVRSSLRLLTDQLQGHIFPVILPALVASVILVRWRRAEPVGLRNTIMFLLGLCIFARLRRLFEYSEWYFYMLEIPVYLLSIQLLTRTVNLLSNGLRLFVALLVLFGLISYYDLGRGYLTRSGPAEMVETPKGMIAMYPNDAREYRLLYSAVERLDPEHRRALFAFGYSGGFNYFLNRMNPTASTQGFRLSTMSADVVVDQVRRHIPQTILLDNRRHLRATVPAVEFAPWRWEQRLVRSHYALYDRPYFELLLAECRPAAVENTPSFFTLYDCAAGRPSARGGIVGYLTRL
jgi:hypothetical protein